MPATEDAICVSRGRGRRGVSRVKVWKTLSAEAPSGSCAIPPGEGRASGKNRETTEGTHRHASEAPERFPLVGLAVPLLVVVCFGHGGLEGRGSWVPGFRYGGRRAVAHCFVAVEPRPLVRRPSLVRTIGHRVVIRIRSASSASVKRTARLPSPSRRRRRHAPRKKSRR